MARSLGKGGEIGPSSASSPPSAGPPPPRAGPHSPQPHGRTPKCSGPRGGVQHPLAGGRTCPAFRQTTGRGRGRNGQSRTDGRRCPAAWSRPVRGGEQLHQLAEGGLPVRLQAGSLPRLSAGRAGFRPLCRLPRDSLIVLLDALLGGLVPVDAQLAVIRHTKVREMSSSGKFSRISSRQKAWMVLIWAFCTRSCCRCSRWSPGRLADSSPSRAAIRSRISAAAALEKVTMSSRLRPQADWGPKSG